MVDNKYTFIQSFSLIHYWDNDIPYSLIHELSYDSLINIYFRLFQIWIFPILNQIPLQVTIIQNGPDF